jgi:hypothetical protein
LRNGFESYRLIRRRREGREEQRRWRMMMLLPYSKYSLPE